MGLASLPGPFPGGGRRGADGGRSGAMWPFLDLVRRLADAGRGPRLVAVENVPGKLSSTGGSDFAAACGALTAAGYRAGALMVDARAFVPQSRERLVILAAAPDIQIPPGIAVPGPSAVWHPAKLAAAAERLPAHVQERWVWWNPAPRTGSAPTLEDVLEPDGEEMRWHPARDTAALLSLMSERDAGRLEAARAAGRFLIGTMTRRMRPAAAEDGSSGRSCGSTASPVACARPAAARRSRA
ncbi:DNA cytosine methyltransferase [Pseudoroseomonas wenyumeiae]